MNFSITGNITLWVYPMHQERTQEYIFPFCRLSSIVTSTGRTKPSPSSAKVPQPFPLPPLPIQAAQNLPDSQRSCIKDKSMNATIPLQEALPWSPDVPRTVLVYDSVENDGNFVLTTMVTHLFATPLHRKSARVLWLSGRPVTDRQVATALKKMGCEVGAAYLRDQQKLDMIPIDGRSAVDAATRPLTIWSLAVDIADQLLSGHEQGGDDKKEELKEEQQASAFDPDLYLLRVYKDLKTWMRQGLMETEAANVPAWIVLDDVSSLSTILGNKTVYCFTNSLCSLLARQNQLDTASTMTKKYGMIIRCSGDMDQTLHKAIGRETRDHSGWVGAGGLAHKQSLGEYEQTSLLWERCLEDSVDAIVDVLPIPSGFSREAHGRLIFSETPYGLGWGSKKSSSASSRSSTASWDNLIINYCVQDTGVRAIRLRAMSGNI